MTFATVSPPCHWAVSVQLTEAASPLAERTAAAVAALLPDAVRTSLPAPLMASDDFANYAERVPSVYFLLHTNNRERGITEPNHSPRFDLDEGVLWRGVAAYLAITLGA